MKTADRLGSFWQRLAPRERTYLLVLVLVFFVMSTLLLLYLRSDAIRESENKVTAVRQALDRIYTQGAVYEEKLRAKKARESSISTERVAFGTLLEEARSGLDVTFSNEEELPATELGEGLLKRTFEFDLRGVNLENLTKFLAAIEGQRGRILLTEGLKITSPSGTEDRLNADVRISTWERQATEPEAEGEEEESP